MITCIHGIAAKRIIKIYYFN
ncbi:hypothetical protein O364_02677, partial [Staphylococcus aureus M0198]